MTRDVRKKTVEEVNIKEGRFVLYQRRLKGVRCACFQEEPAPNHTCPHCYGTGIDGGYYDPWVGEFRNAAYEEVQKSTVTEGNTTTTSSFLDEWVQLTFECDFETHLYYQCLLDLDLHLWSVVGVEQVPDDEDYDGLPLPSRWCVTARRVQEYESSYRFMRDHTKETLEAYSNADFPGPANRKRAAVLIEEEGPMLVNTGGLGVGKLLYVCPECGKNVTVEGPRSLDEEIADEIHCDSCGHTWSNEEDLKKRGLE